MMNSETKVQWRNLYRAESRGRGRTWIPGENGDEYVDPSKPWWEDCPRNELLAGIARLENCLWACKGRAADMFPILARHIVALHSFADGRGYEARPGIYRHAGFKFTIPLTQRGLFD